MSLASNSATPEVGRLRALRNTAQNALLERELCAIAQSFAEAGIALLVLKGVPLTRRLYGGLERRYSVDNDLLVRRVDAERAQAVLAELGYASSSNRSLADDLASNFQHPMRRNEADGTVLRAELHWHAFPPELFAVPETELWAHAVPYPLRAQSILVFDEVMTLLHLASHHVQHRCAEAKVLDDVGAAWQRFGAGTDTAELAALATRYGLCGALAFSLNAAYRAGSCSSPPPISSPRAALLARVMPEARHGAEPGYAAIVGSLLLASPRQISAALLRELFPPPPVLARVYGVPQSPWLYLRYPLRLLRPARKWLSRARPPEAK
jgi:hypothetical protein